MNKQEVLEKLEQKRETILRSQRNLLMESELWQIYEARAATFMKAINIVEQLDEPQVTDEQAWNKIAEAYPETVQSLRSTLDHAVFGQAVDPQKVRVPQFVGEWIEYVKKKGDSFHDTFKPWDLYGAEYHEVDAWIARNEEKYACAWLDGYEAEQEPKYQVKLKFGRQYLSKNSDGTALDFYSCMHPVPSFSKSELSEIEDGAFYKADGDKEWINPIIELVPVEKV